MADEEVTPLVETYTTNYGWTKPEVGASADLWGGYLNADLDGIDSTVKSISNAIPAASSTTPIMDGTAAVGTGTTFARADHVHPTDTSRYAASNPSGYQTAAQVTTSLAPYAPLASPAFTGTPSMPTGTTGVTQTAGDSSTKLATTAFITAATAAVMGDNRIINGDMRIDQRNNGVSGTANNVYTVDRWGYFGTQASKGTWQRIATSAAPGFPYALMFQSSSAYASLAGDNFEFYQSIEADMVSDFAWGAAGAQPVTLSFWAFSSLTGMFSGSFRNYAATRSYPFSFSIPTANTWTKITTTISGDTAGTWVMSGGNGGAVTVNFDLGSGATLRGPANAWASANYIGVTGAVSVVSTNAATFYVTGVKLEIGSVATPFNRQSLAKSMADCQRYYQTSGGVCLEGCSSGASAAVGSTIWFQVQMRVFPTLVHSGESYSNGSGLAFDQITQNVCRALWTGSSAGRSAISGLSFNLSAEL
jgi:hypothetical protein